MYIFIDESGIHKNFGKSSFASVYIEIRNLHKIRQELFDINKNLNIKSFHWSEQRWNLRHRYLKRVINLDFKFKVAIFDNPININHAFTVIFEHVIREDKIRSIVIDGKKPKWYENKLKKELRDQGIKVKKLTTVRNETSEPVLQLADALAGFSLYVFENQDDRLNKVLFEKYRKLGKLLAKMIFY